MQENDPTTLGCSHRHQLLHHAFQHRLQRTLTEHVSSNPGVEAVEIDGRGHLHVEDGAIDFGLQLFRAELGISSGRA